MKDLLSQLSVKSYTTDYTDKLLSYADMIIATSDVKEIEITNGVADMYRGDFAKVCTKVLDVDLKYLPLMLRLNGYKSSIEYDGATIIKMIDPNIIDNFFKDNKK